jgi:hypothetical protein
MTYEYDPCPRCTTTPNEPCDWCVMDQFQPADLALMIARTMETDPEHPAILAIRMALEVADNRRAERGAIREAALDVHGGDTDYWRRFADNHVPYTEIERRRRAAPMYRKPVTPHPDLITAFTVAPFQLAAGDVA